MKNENNGEEMASKVSAISWRSAWRNNHREKIISEMAYQ